MEVAGIKEGALSVFSGQRQFPLTFQMPESGLALRNRRCDAITVRPTPFPAAVHPSHMHRSIPCPPPEAQ